MRFNTRIIKIAAAGLTRLIYKFGAKLGMSISILHWEMNIVIRRCISNKSIIISCTENAQDLSYLELTGPDNPLHQISHQHPIL